MTKKIFTTLCLSILLFSCNKDNNEKKEKPFTIGIVFTSKGLGNNEFKEYLYENLKAFEKKEDVKFEYIVSDSLADIKENLYKYTQNNDDLVIGTGFLTKSTIKDLAEKYPNQKFAILDDQVELPNVISALFDQEKGAFLMGALASMITKTNTIGFVGGMKVRSIEKFENGYVQGAKYINPDIKVISKYTDGMKPFSNLLKGRENTALEIKKGADVIYHAAGGTGIGVIQEAKKEHVYAIGADINQDSLDKGVVLNSMTKRLDNAIFKIVETSKSGNFNDEIIKFNLSNDGVGITDFEFTKDVIGENRLNRLKNIQAKLINDEIKMKYLY